MLQGKAEALWCRGGGLPVLGEADGVCVCGGGGTMLAWPGPQRGGGPRSVLRGSLGLGAPPLLLL